MKALAAARAHLAKAREFLDAAEIEVDELPNAATSNAVTSGINSKDAICLAVTGKTGKTDNHGDAVAELRAAGKKPATLASTLSRLLKLKNKSQYQAVDVSKADATKAVAWAAALYDAAYELVPVDEDDAQGGE